MQMKKHKIKILKQNKNKLNVLDRINNDYLFKKCSWSTKMKYIKSK